MEREEQIPKLPKKKDSVEGMRTHKIENMSIDDKIEYWHTHETGNSLIEFLGMTEQEYFDFCMDGIKTKTKK